MWWRGLGFAEETRPSSPFHVGPPSDPRQAPCWLSRGSHSCWPGVPRTSAPTCQAGRRQRCPQGLARAGSHTLPALRASTQEPGASRGQVCGRVPGGAPAAVPHPGAGTAGRRLEPSRGHRCRDRPVPRRWARSSATGTRIPHHRPAPAGQRADPGSRPSLGGQGRPGHTWAGVLGHPHGTPGGRGPGRG